MIGKPISALADARKAVALDPKFVRAAVRVATCHLRMGDFREAASAVGGLLERLPQGGQHWGDVAKKVREVQDVAAGVAAVRQQVRAEWGARGGGRGGAPCAAAAFTP